MKQSELLRQARHLGGVLTIICTNGIVSENSVLNQQISTLYGQSLVAQHLNKFDLVFSAGPYCRSAFHLRRLFDSQVAFPFDWWLTPASSLLRMLDPKYVFKLSQDEVFLTQSGQIVLNSRDQVLHLHDFKRLQSGKISLANLEIQLNHINSKFCFLFKRLHDRLHAAKNCMLIFEGLMPAIQLESYRIKSSCKELTYPILSNDFAVELVDMLRINYNVNSKLVCFKIGPPAIEQLPQFLRISAPALASKFDMDAEAYQRPWATYDMLFAQLCAAIADE